MVIATGLAIVGPFVFAAIFARMLAWERRWRRWALFVIIPLMMASPLLIPPDYRVARFLATASAFVPATKVFDLHIANARLDRPGFWAFLLNPFILVQRKLDHEPRPSTRQNLRRLALGTALLAAWLPMRAVAQVADLGASSFWIDHGVRVLLLYLFLEGACLVLTALWRLGGGVARDPMDWPILARTPAEFWRRYNRMTYQFLWEDVFKPSGGSRRPVQGVLLTFLVSALAHEYLFAITLGRADGTQFAFFMLQGVGVALTIRARPRGPWAWAGWIATVLYLFGTSVLFFSNFRELFPLD